MNAPAKRLVVERRGWRVEILAEEPRTRPRWEIRCEIQRARDNVLERRGHRFYVEQEIAEALRLDDLPSAHRLDLMARAVKQIVMRELEPIFAEPEGGLDSVRALRADDFKG